VSSQQKTVDYILEQSADAGTMTAKKMFGEYGLYCDGKIMALLCDDQLYVKPTQAGRDYLGEVTDGSPFPGAKPYFLIEGDRWDDAEWLAGLVKTTADDLPAPKPKKAKKG
jgi:TfoX/Sxy family transcriptional regulator of competence genes